MSMVCLEVSADVVAEAEDCEVIKTMWNQEAELKSCKLGEQVCILEKRQEESPSL